MFTSVLKRKYEEDFTKFLGPFQRGFLAVREGFCVNVAYGQHVSPENSSRKENALSLFLKLTRRPGQNTGKRIPAVWHPEP